MSNITKVSDEVLSDAFAEAYEEQVASLNGVAEYECDAQRNTSTGDVDVIVTVIGLCGTPCYDDYKDGKVSDSDEVNISTEHGDFTFAHLPEEDKCLNTNDYTVVYRMEK